MFKRKQIFKTIESGPTVAEIHRDFHAEVDRIVQSAKNPKSLDSPLEALIEKRKKLQSLGFNNTLEIQKTDKEVTRLNQLERENEEALKDAEAANYFAQKYPLYRFITIDSVKKLCKKYELIFGDVNHYLGEVPDKNLDQLLNCKIDKEDLVYQVYHGHYMEREPSLVNFYKASKLNKYILNKTPLVIVASPKEFDLDNMNVKDFEITKKYVPDPIVLEQVYYEGKRHFLILTAWGEEAGDELVVNSLSN